MEHHTGEVRIVSAALLAQLQAAGFQVFYMIISLLIPMHFIIIFYLYL